MFKQRLSPFVLFCCGLLILSCQSSPTAPPPSAGESTTPVATSLFGEALYAPKASEKLLAKLKTHQVAYEAEPSSVDKLIWYGRFLAYSGDYSAAIALYSKGIQQFPKEARLYRHRGHRYISIRKFEDAISDLEKASQLIEGQANEMEPDGMPNALNTPVSSKHGNIWYHLGLAYYLKQDMPNALRAYEQCLAATNNADNVVSTTHWLYMIRQRMGQAKEAAQYLEAISDTLSVIENGAYHKACLFYKGLLPIDSITQALDAAPGNDALQYALGNWYQYHNQEEKMNEVYTNLLKKGMWNSFGYIAAEADLAAIRGQAK